MTISNIVIVILIAKVFANEKCKYCDYFETKEFEWR